MIAALFVWAACAGQPAPPVVEEPVPYSLSLPGVIPASMYEQVRARPALQRGLDDRMVPALASDAPPADRVAAFLKAREEALGQDAEAQRTPARLATAEELMAGPIGPPPGDPVLRTFDRVCTDVLRTWFRSYADWLAARPDVAMERRAEDLKALEAAAPTAFPWAPGEGESARVEVMLARAAMLEAAEGR